MYHVVYRHSSVDPKDLYIDFIKIDFHNVPWWNDETKEIDLPTLFKHLNTMNEVEGNVCVYMDEFDHYNAAHGKHSNTYLHNYVRYQMPKFNGKFDYEKYESVKYLKRVGLWVPGLHNWQGQSSLYVADHNIPWEQREDQYVFLGIIESIGCQWAAYVDTLPYNGDTSYNVYADSTYENTNPFLIDNILREHKSSNDITGPTTYYTPLPIFETNEQASRFLLYGDNIDEALNAAKKQYYIRASLLHEICDALRERELIRYFQPAVEGATKSYKAPQQFQLNWFSILARWIKMDQNESVLSHQGIPYQTEIQVPKGLTPNPNQKYYAIDEETLVSLCNIVKTLYSKHLNMTPFLEKNIKITDLPQMIRDIKP